MISLLFDLAKILLWITLGMLLIVWLTSPGLEVFVDRWLTMMLVLPLSLIVN